MKASVMGSFFVAVQAAVLSGARSRVFVQGPLVPVTPLGVLRGHG